MNEVVVNSIDDCRYNDDSTMFIFKDKSSDEIVDFLKKLNTLELEFIESNKKFDIHLNFKSIGFSDRISIMKWALQNNDLVDSSLILNIFNFIKGYNTFDDTFFDSKEVIVNDLEEFLDMKTALSTEISYFVKNLAKYYFSIIKTVGVTDFPSNNLPETIPFIYQRVLLISDFISLSNIVKGIKSIDELIYVENAEMFLQSLSNKYLFSQILMNKTGMLINK